MNQNGSYSGRTHDRYEFLELIGTGSFGEVYNAFDKKLLRNVAIKAATASLVENDKIPSGIIDEARIHARAEHTNIVPIYDVLDYENTILIVMRLIPGEDLEHMLKRLSRPLDIGEALNIMYQVLLAMEYAHSKGIVHQDLKPSNIRLSYAGEVLVMDFGIASVMENQILTNEIHGTPSYMAPEQIKHSYIDARSDIYSLGVILYKMVTGHLPFEKATTIDQLLKYHVEQTPINPTEFIPSLPEKFVKTILKSLEKRARDRFHSCREFALALEDSIEETRQSSFGSKESRWDPRVAVYLKARIQLSEDSEYIPADTMSISANGASLRILADIPIGSKIHVDFYLPDENNYKKIHAKATIVWKDKLKGIENTEIGVSLDEVIDIDRHYIAVFVRNLLLSGQSDELPSERTMTFDH